MAFATTTKRSASLREIHARDELSMYTARTGAAPWHLGASGYNDLVPMLSQFLEAVGLARGAGPRTNSPERSAGGPLW